MAQFQNWSTAWLGLGLPPDKLTVVQVSLRGVVIFFVALLLVRLSDRRSLTKKSPFAIVLLVVIASVLARAVNGSAPFLPTIVGTAVIVAIHRLIAYMAARWPKFSRVVKGRSVLLMEDGKFLREAMRQESIADEDVREDLRLNAKTDELEKVKSARLEVSGNVSFIMRDSSK